MPAYLIVNYNVENPELYGAYAAAAAPALNIGTDCQLVAMDPKSERIEGDTAGHQTVVLKYESREKARAAYESGAYQEIVGKRHDATSAHFAVLIDGIV